MSNIKQIIGNHNKAILGQTSEEEETKPCNCRVKADCPIKGESCRTKNVVYQATVTTEETTRNYIGLAATEFKERFRNHKHTFNDKKKKNVSELSKLIWDLKEENEHFTIEWKFLRKVKKARARSITCNLCLEEAKEIMKKDQNCINKRNEIMGKCRHIAANRLRNWMGRKQKKKPGGRK